MWKHTLLQMLPLCSPVLGEGNGKASDWVTPTAVAMDCTLTYFSFFLQENSLAALAHKWLLCKNVHICSLPNPKAHNYKIRLKHYKWLITQKSKKNKEVWNESFCNMKVLCVLFFPSLLNTKKKKKNSISMVLPHSHYSPGDPFIMQQIYFLVCE